MTTRNPKPRFWRTPALPGTVGDAPIVFARPPRRKHKAWRNARTLRKRPTRAEQHLEALLNALNDGVLKDRFFTQWAFADKWILDFFFHENRLGIEVDGSIHDKAEQQIRDRAKDAACREWGITLIRVTNSQVFGPEEALVQILRDGWRQACRNIKSSEFARS